MASQKKMAEIAERLSQKDIKALVEAYGIFNKEWFGGQLPKVKLTFRKMKTAYGKWKYVHEVMDGAATPVGGELLMNPDLCARKEIPWLLLFLLHEMCHVEQTYVLGVVDLEHDAAFERRLHKLEQKLLKKYGYAIVLRKGIQ